MALGRTLPPGYGMAYRYHRETQWEAGTVPLSSKPVCGSIALFCSYKPSSQHCVIPEGKQNKTGN